MKNIKKISYGYTRDFKDPINYQIQTDEITTTMNYKDALDIAYAVIDSLGGNYDYIEEIREKFENRGIKFEEV